MPRLGVAARMRVRFRLVGIVVVVLVFVAVVSLEGEVEQLVGGVGVVIARMDGRMDGCDVM